MKSINKISKHLQQHHNISINRTEFWCGLCGDFMLKNPRTHSCFRHIQFYNVDFTKYAFKHVCNRCNFGTQIRSVLNQHKCHLTPIHAEFPSSDPNQSPPHRVFQGRTPHLASSIPSQSQDIAHPTQLSSTPLQLSLVSEAPCTQQQIQHEINAENMINTMIDEAIQPSSGSTPVTSHILAGTVCRIRETNQVHFVFPINKYLRCTEAGCDSTFVSGVWSVAHFDLIRHIRDVHKIPEPQSVQWCAFCKIIISPVISRHKCFNEGDYYSIPDEVKNAQPFNFKCLQCNTSFPTATALSNHNR